MNDEQTKLFDEVLGQTLDRVKENLKTIIDDEVTDIYCGLLPYVSNDVVSNAMLQAEDLFHNVITGDFKWDGDYIVIAPARTFSPRVRMAMTHQLYDSLRDALIEHMPTCPKDAKIEALERELNELRYAR